MASDDFEGELEKRVHFECPRCGYVDPNDPDAEQPTCPNCNSDVDVLVERVGIKKIEGGDNGQ